MVRNLAKAAEKKSLTLECRAAVVQAGAVSFRMSAWVCYTARTLMLGCRTCLIWGTNVDGVDFGAYGQGFNAQGVT